LPNSWREYVKLNGNEFTNTLLSIESGIMGKYKALRKLELLRDCYNDGWTADWSDSFVSKEIIIFESDYIKSCSVNSYTRVFLNFKTADLRDKFLENFKDIIEIAKPLL